MLIRRLDHCEIDPRGAQSDKRKREKEEQALTAYAPIAQEEERRHRGRRSSVVKSRQTPSLSIEHITRSILVLRGQRVLLDVELADLYGVGNQSAASGCKA
jgi:hypothetical protein